MEPITLERFSPQGMKISQLVGVSLHLQVVYYYGVYLTHLKLIIKRVLIYSVYSEAQIY